MIESHNEVSKDLEKALRALEQAKQHVANENKKQNEKMRKAENHHKYIMGGIIVKYLVPDTFGTGRYVILSTAKFLFLSFSSPIFFGFY